MIGVAGLLVIASIVAGVVIGLRRRRNAVSESLAKEGKWMSD